MKILNTIISWHNSQEMVDVARQMGFSIILGEQNSTTDALCENCISEHIQAGDIVTVIGESDQKSCSSCGARHWWKSPN